MCNRCINDAISCVGRGGDEDGLVIRPTFYVCGGGEFRGRGGDVGVVVFRRTYGRVVDYRSGLAVVEYYLDAVGKGECGFREACVRANVFKIGACGLDADIVAGADKVAFGDDLLAFGVFFQEVSCQAVHRQEKTSQLGGFVKTVITASSSRGGGASSCALACNAE